MRKVEGGEQLSWGYLACDTEDDELLLELAVSRDNFDRIVSMLQTVGPPSANVGFSEKGDGPITEHDGGYRWDPEIGYINIEECEFRYARTAPQNELEVPERAPKLLRGLGAAFTVAVSLVALLVAVGMFGAAGSKFETAIVSVLLLIYVNGVTSSGVVGRAMIQLELASIARFLSLREHLGVPISPEEQRYLTLVGERSGKPGASYWITMATNSIIALLAAYHLVALLG